MRTVTANFSGGQTFVATESLWQYDYGFVLVLQGLELPPYYEVHFSHTFTSLADVNIGDANGVAIDDKFLRHDGYLFAWVYLHDEATDGYTKYQVKIPIAKRAKPPEDPPTHEQQEALAQAITALNEQTGLAEDAADRAEQAEANAQASEQAAEGYKNDAVDAKEDAQSAASTATQKAQDAAGYANVASRQAEIATNKALEASLSADNAEESEHNAGVSAGQAADSATTAGNAKDEAKNARDLAQGYATDANESKLAAEAAKESVEDMLEAFQRPTATAVTLEPGSDATASYNGETGVFTFGIPKGKDGYSPRASVSQDGDVTTITITDENGTTTADIDLSDYAKDDELTELGHTKAPVIIDSASGAIASFPDGADGMPVHKLLVNLSPKQDLHGYDNPWPEGGGVNKVYVSDNIDTTNNGVRFKSKDGGIEVNGTATSTYPQIVLTSYEYTFAVGQTVTISKTIIGTVPSGGYVYFIYTEYDGEELIRHYLRTAQTETFVVSKDRQSLSIIAEGNGVTFSNIVAKFQAELGSTATAWTPYSNICPISGWTGCEVNADGKNLLDPNYRQNLQRNVKLYIGTGFLVKANTTYTFSVSAASAQNQVVEIGGSQLAVNYGKTSLTFTPSKDAYVYFDAYYNDGFQPPSGGTSAIDCQLELGSAATAYEPFRGNSYSVAFGKTLYHADIDVISGEGSGLTEKVVYNGTVGGSSDFASVEVGQYTDQDFTMFVLTLQNQERYSSNGDILAIYAMCNILPWKFANQDGTAHWYKSARVGVFIPASIATTVEEFNAFAANQPLEFVLALAYEEQETITPTPVSTLKGQNNIWANGDSVEVEYCADTKLYIDKKLAALVAALS